MGKSMVSCRFSLGSIHWWMESGARHLQVFGLHPWCVHFSVALRIKNHHVAEKGQVFEEVGHLMESFESFLGMGKTFFLWVNHENWGLLPWKSSSNVDFTVIDMFFDEVTEDLNSSNLEPKNYSLNQSRHIGSTVWQYHHFLGFHSQTIVVAKL